MKGILFKAEMVRAIPREVDPKWQTRRGMNHPNLKETPKDCQLVRWEEYPDGTLRPIFEVEDQQFSVKPPYRQGETVYVKETWAAIGKLAGGELELEDSCIRYRATWDKVHYKGWKASLIMPERFARYFIKITRVRAEWLPDISEVDAIAEGIEQVTSIGPLRAMGWRDYSGGPGFLDPRNSYRSLTEMINGPGAWERWVWVYDFQRVPKP